MYFINNMYICMLIFIKEYYKNITEFIYNLHIKLIIKLFTNYYSKHSFI